MGSRAVRKVVMSEFIHVGYMSELTTAGLVVGVEAEKCNKIIRIQAVQVKEEMEEPNATTMV
jgi:hypothetical protein